jgi:hypothetical protein
MPRQRFVDRHVDLERRPGAICTSRERAHPQEGRPRRWPFRRGSMPRQLTTRGALSRHRCREWAHGTGAGTQLIGSDRSTTNDCSALRPDGGGRFLPLVYRQIHNRESRNQFAGLRTSRRRRGPIRPPADQSIKRPARICFWDQRGLLSKTARSVAQGCASCPPLGESLDSFLLCGADAPKSVFKNGEEPDKMPLW